MTGRDRRYGKSRQASLKAKAGIATAVLVGGGAIGVAAVAANSHSPATSAESASYSSSGLSSEQLLVSALSTSNVNSSLSDFSRMSGVRNFNQWWYHKKMFAAQKGIVVLATKKFIILESANKALHLWWLSGKTLVKDVATSTSAMNSLTANVSVASTAMTGNNMVPATSLIAGSTTTAAALVAPTTTTQTVTVAVAGTSTTVKVTVTSTTATVTTTTGTTTAKTWQNAWFAPQKVARGDLALIAGFRQNWNLHAQIVLFAPLTKSDLTKPSSSTSSSSFSGTHS